MRPFPPVESLLRLNVVFLDKRSISPVLSAVNLSGYSHAAQIRKSYDSSSATVAFTTTTSDASAGQFTLALSNSQTAAIPHGRYVYDAVITSAKGDVVINYETSPYLATAGSGDVLAGIIGGLILHYKDPFKAAKIGCYIHSNCALKLGPGLIASDLIKMIPEVIKEIK